MGFPLPDLSDTIAAEATPPGRGAVRVVRVSGPGSLKVLDTLFEPDSGPPPSARPRGAVLGTLKGAGGEAADRCLALAFPGPASFTGEDCAELHLHGSPGLVRETLRLLLRHGIRQALPGEFSYRAFLHGKLSLLGAESTDALVACETGGQARRFGPEASAALEAEVRELLDTLEEQEARMEAAVDFPDDVEGNFGSAAGALGHLAVRLGALAEAGERLRPLREGWTVALAGAPNAGKSSLFNALLRRERALVSPHPGTTRDVLSETLEVGGFPLTLLDTAGGRESGDELERLGVEAARRAAAEADALLFVFDGVRGWDSADARLLEQCPRVPLALVSSRADLGGPPDTGAPAHLPLLRTSAVTGEGLDALCRLLGTWMEGVLPSTRALPMNSRQAGAALEASRALARSRDALAQGFTEEVALQGVRDARRHLEEVLGGGDPETLYERIFSAFCIGK